MEHQPGSTKPYLLRALYEWCVDNGFTPYLQVVVDKNTVVPKEFIKGGEIVLNVGPLASNKLKIGNEHIEFQARFGGVARDLYVPITAVAAIYAKENGQGMSFEPERPDESRADSIGPAHDATAAKETSSHQTDIKDASAHPNQSEPPPRSPTPGGRPALRRVK
ncbi:MAG: ClpXP protease specificity-enhancing factor [Burkholderiales bacterium]